MQARPPRDALSSLDAPNKQLLQAHQLERAEDLMMYTAVDLCEVMNISMERAQHLLTAASACIAPAYVTAAQLLQRAQTTQPLLTGLPDLDRALRRGVPVGAISEFVGPAGVGKSQLCMMLALLVAGPATVGIEAPIVYADTESKFSSVRLAEMARSRLHQLLPTPLSEQQQQAVEASISAMMKRILLVQCHSAEDLMRALYGLETVVSERGVRLVVVDSMAAIARSEFGGGMASMLARQEMLGTASSLLKSVAETYQIPVLATNQVSARTGGPAEHMGVAQGGGAAAAAGPQGLSATLGTLWAHSVNLRLVLERVGDCRYIKLVKSPTSANVSVEYAVTQTGLVQSGAGLLIAPGSAFDVSIANERDQSAEE